MQYAPTTSLPTTAPNGVTAGLDWASTDHAVCVVDTAGKVTTRFTVEHTDAGLKDLTRRLAKPEHRLAAGLLAHVGVAGDLEELRPDHRAVRQRRRSDQIVSVAVVGLDGQ